MIFIVCILWKLKKSDDLDFQLRLWLREKKERNEKRKNHVLGGLEELKGRSHRLEACTI